MNWRDCVFECAEGPEWYGAEVQHGIDRSLVFPAGNKLQRENSEKEH